MLVDLTAQRQPEFADSYIVTATYKADFRRRRYHDEIELDYGIYRPAPQRSRAAAGRVGR